MAEEDQGVEKPKCRSCDDEHVDRDNVGHVVLQKGAPGRGGDFGSPRQISPDRGLADFNTKLEQFTVNSRPPPKAGWQCSLGGSDHGYRSSPWAGPRSVILIATASTAGNPCDATGSQSPASPAPWRSRPAAKSGKATSRAVGLLRRSEADLGAAAVARRADVEGRRPQVRGRRGDESGKRVRKRGRT